MRTGTFAPATLSSLSRTACMILDRPNTTESGGISPSDWTSELTGFADSIAICLLRLLKQCFSMHPESQTKVAPFGNIGMVPKWFLYNELKELCFTLAQHVRPWNSDSW